MKIIITPSDVDKIENELKERWSFFNSLSDPYEYVRAMEDKDGTMMYYRVEKKS